jgi:hypothetical protein
LENLKKNLEEISPYKHLSSGKIRDLKDLKFKNFRLKECLDYKTNDQSLNLLGQIALAYKFFRFKLPPDYREALNFLTNPPDEKKAELIYNRATLGLPIPHISSSKITNLRLQISRLSYKEKTLNRLQTPFIFKVLNSEEFLLILFIPKKISSIYNDMQVYGKFQEKDNKKWKTKKEKIRIKFGFKNSQEFIPKEFSEEQIFLLEKLMETFRDLFEEENNE